MFVCCAVLAMAVAACATTSTSASLNAMCVQNFQTLAEHARQVEEDGLDLMGRIETGMIPRDRITLKNDVLMWEQIAVSWTYLADDKVGQKDKVQMATDVAQICWNVAYRIRHLAELYTFVDNDTAIIERLASDWDKESHWWASTGGSPCLYGH